MDTHSPSPTMTVDEILAVIAVGVESALAQRLERAGAPGHAGQTDQHPRLMTSAQACRYLGTDAHPIPDSALRGLVRDGLVTPHVDGGTRYFSSFELDRFLESTPEPVTQRRRLRVAA